MYNPPHRPSILHRPLKGKSQATTETFDTQHEREQQYWAAKAQRSQQTQDRILKNLYPTPEDKVEAADECRLALDQHAKAKEYERLHAQAQEDLWTRPSTAMSDRAQQQDRRPWQATTFTAYGSKEEEDLQRRRVASQVAVDNRLAIQQNAARRAHEEEVDRQLAHMTVTDESSFWNLGSTNDRWLPPERRRSPRGDGHWAAAGQGPAHLRAPYASDAQPPTMQQPGAGPAAEAQGAVRPVPQPIWAWNEQPAAVQGEEKARRVGAVEMPWATELAYGGAEPPPPPLELWQQQQLQQRHGSRPGPARCPFATDQDLPQEREREAAPAAAAAAWAAAPPHLRYSSRPSPQPRPYAQDSDDVHVRPASAYAHAYAAPPDPVAPLPPAVQWDQTGPPLPTVQWDLAGPPAGPAYPAAGQMTRPATATTAQRFGSRPEPQPCPFAIDPPASKQPQVWAPPPPNRAFPWL